jgi:hypothetical protein
VARTLGYTEKLKEETKKTADHYSTIVRRANAVVDLTDRILTMMIKAKAAREGVYDWLGAGGSMSDPEISGGGGGYTGGTSVSGSPAAAAATGDSFTTTRPASNQALIQARIRANEALGFEKYDVTLGDLPDRIGKAVAGVYAEQATRPSFRTQLAAAGVG